MPRRRGSPAAPGRSLVLSRNYALIGGNWRTTGASVAHPCRQVKFGTLPGPRHRSTLSTKRAASGGARLRAVSAARRASASSPSSALARARTAHASQSLRPRGRATARAAASPARTRSPPRPAGPARPAALEPRPPPLAQELGIIRPDPGRRGERREARHQLAPIAGARLREGDLRGQGPRSGPARRVAARLAQRRLALLQ